MRVPLSANPAQARQTRERLANPEDKLSYELGKAVQELPPFYTRILSGSICLLVFGTIAWAHYSKVDEVAIAQGELIPSAAVRPIRALDAGTIQTVMVKEGQPVKKDQTLVEVAPKDPELNTTRAEELQKSAQLINEDIARLEAERSGRLSAGNLLQDQLLTARLNEFDTKKASAQSEANRQLLVQAEARAQLERLQENLINARETLRNAQRREQMLSSLKGLAVPQLDYIRAQDELTQARDKVVSTEKEIDAQQERIRQAEAAYQSASSTADGLSSQRRSEILTQLTRRREELTNVRGQINQTKQQLEQTTVKSPFNGTVYNIKATRGPVQPGEELLSIVPQGENLILEVKVLNRDIAFIHKGQRAKVKMAAFPYQEFGIVEGEVMHISPNAIVEKDIGLVFPTRILLEKRTIRVRGQDVALAPGMAGAAEIVTRKKSILQFMIEPISRRFDEAFSSR